MKKSEKTPKTPKTRKLWIATAVDTSETADGKARVLGVFKTMAEAKRFVKSDIEDYVDDAKGMDLVHSFGRMTAHTADYQYGCEWNVEEVEIPE